RGALRMVFLRGREWPDTPERLPHGEDRCGGPQPLESRHEAPVDEGRPDTERGVVAAELVGCSIRLDDLDAIFEARGRRAFAGGGDELRRAFDARQPAAECLGEKQG